MNDSLFMETYPTLFQHLTQTEWGPKQPRATSTLTMYVDDGALICVVNDRDSNRSAFFSAETLTDLLDVVEIGLREDTAEWKNKKWQKPTGAETPF